MPPPDLLIRDAQGSDVEACLALDCSYATAWMWQMSIDYDDGVWQTAFRSGRLPRKVEVTETVYPNRLYHSLADEHCFLVATNTGETPAILGYLTLSLVPGYETAHIYDLVVDRPLRRQGIATRLLNAGRTWAHEKNARRLVAEARTKNYPAIRFFQHCGLVYCGFNDQYLPQQDIAVFFGQALR